MEKVCWSWTLLDMDLIDRYNRQSSVNRHIEVCASITLCRSFIKHIKKWWPQYGPWRTTEATLCALEWIPSPQSPPVLAVRKEHIQERSSLCVPTVLSMTWTRTDVSASEMNLNLNLVIHLTSLQQTWLMLFTHDGRVKVHRSQLTRREHY